MSKDPGTWDYELGTWSVAPMPLRMYTIEQFDYHNFDYSPSNNRSI